MIKGNSKDKNDSKETADRKSGEKEKKSSGLLSRILKEYPWPDKKNPKNNAEKEKVKAENTRHDIDGEEISRYRNDEKEIASGSGTSKTDTPYNQNQLDKEKMRLRRLNEK
jgi:hypothetical protein